MLKTLNLGYPRIGLKREIKKALEAFWRGEITQSALEDISVQVRKKNWEIQDQSGINSIPSNDFSFYDHVLDMAFMFNAIPEQYRVLEKTPGLFTYFAMARGLSKQGLTAMEMTKWFDTNYHYIVPEINIDTKFMLLEPKPVNEFILAKRHGFHTRPVILGPVSFLLLSKSIDPDFDPLDKLEELLSCYVDLFAELNKAGADWIQMDEPYLVMDLTPKMKDAFQSAYASLAKKPHPNIMLATYFDGFGENLSLAVSLPVEGIHYDAVYGKDQYEEFLKQAGNEKLISLGVIDGRNIWRADMNEVIDTIEKARDIIPDEKLRLSTSCSLLHVPQDVNLELNLDDEIKSWLSFARQKLEELHSLVEWFSLDADRQLEQRKQFTAQTKLKQNSDRIHNQEVEAAVSSIDSKMLSREVPRDERKKLQIELPLFPTTTIGSFPQTKQIRKVRAQFRKGEIDRETYDEFIKEEIERVIRFQEEIDLDVLVHGEFERNDMVQYFAEKLEGFAFTTDGWVQSYGSRYVRPPIIFGDVSRPEPMTVKWTSWAQSITEKPVKGMLTGPLTIMKWSFVRNDQPLETTCKQIALAVREEVLDLEKVGIRIIQIDEPALREGLPLKQQDREDYLRWSIESFHIAADGVSSATQIHTHMCYSEFNEMLDSIAAMDADVISIEASRSKMELLDAFKVYEYPNEVGPGVYDIHSPRVPDETEMFSLLQKAAAVLEPHQLWVNPDCGLKTRGWQETKPTLSAMVRAAKRMRKQY